MKRLRKSIVLNKLGWGITTYNPTKTHIYTHTHIVYNVYYNVLVGTCI